MSLVMTKACLESDQLLKMFDLVISVHLACVQSYDETINNYLCQGNPYQARQSTSMRVERPHKAC